MHNLKNALKNLQIEYNTTEFHGFVCGFLAANTTSVDSWLFDLIGKQDLQNMTAKEAVLSILEFSKACREDLDDEQFKFELILDEEGNSFADRLVALRQWCDGFLYAFGLSGAVLEEGSEAREIIKDLSEFARVDCGQNHDKEAEIALMEIVEYIKVSILLIYTETKSAKSKLSEDTMSNPI